MREIVIKGGHGGRIDVAAAERLEIINIVGQQICDFFAFRADDLGEFVSPAHTRAELMRVALRKGGNLVSVRGATSWASVAAPGDKVVLEAMVDVLAVGSACAMDLTGINGARPSGIRFVARAR